MFLYMKSVFLICFFIAQITFSQQTKLYKTWYVDSISHGNKALEVDNPMYSTLLTFHFQPKHILIDSHKKQSYQIIDSTLLVGDQKYTFSFRENQLILDNLNEDLRYFFLTEQDFQEKYSSYFNEDLQAQNEGFLFGDSYLEQYFFHDKTFHNFVQTEMMKYREFYNSTKEGRTTINYVIDEHNQLESYEVKETNNKSYTKYYKKALEKALPFIKNDSNKKLKMSYTHNVIAPSQSMRKNVDVDVFSLFVDEELEHIKQLFQQKKYREVVQLLENEDVESKELHKALFKEEKKRLLAVSLLQLNENQRACAILNSYKGLAQLRMRNYITNFCTK